MVARFDVVRTLAFGSISGTYTAVGTPVLRNWREFRISNTTDGAVYISVDQVNDNFYLPAHSFVLWDLATNAIPIGETDSFVLAVNTQFYVKSSAVLTIGGVFIEGIYARRTS